MSAMLAVAVIIMANALNVGFQHFCPENGLSGYDNIADIELIHVKAHRRYVERKRRRAFSPDQISKAFQRRSATDPNSPQ